MLMTSGQKLPSTQATMLIEGDNPPNACFSLLCRFPSQRLGILNIAQEINTKIQKLMQMTIRMKF